MLAGFGPESERHSDGQDAVDVEEGLGASLQGLRDSGSAVDEQGDGASLDAVGEVVPLSVGEIFLESRRSFSRKIVLIRKIESGIIGNFDSDFRVSFESGQ